MKRIYQIAGLALILLLPATLTGCFGNDKPSASSSFSSSESSLSSSRDEDPVIQPMPEPDDLRPDLPDGRPDDDEMPHDSGSTDGNSSDSSKDPLQSDDNADKPGSKSDASVGMAGEGISALPTYEPAVVPDEAALAQYDNRCIGWGPGTERDENGQIVGATRAQAQYGDLGALFIGANEKVVYLTFDEGYENGYTAQILDILRDRQVPAVFFVTADYAVREPALVQRMIDEGHTVGNHSVSHRSMPTLSVADAAEEILGLHALLQQDFGYTATLFRPPEGSFSERTLALTKALGYRSVFWSFAHVDWKVDAQPSPQEALSRMQNGLHPGAVYLLHAVSSANTEALGDFIDSARAEGYRFALPA